VTDPVKLNFSDAGHGTPVVLLHGFPLSSAIWRQQQQLSDLYRVITPDLRGHGQSPDPPGVYEMESLALDVLALLDSLVIAKAAIVGHSMGGYVALAAWNLAPHRLLALGLIDSQATADTEEGRISRLKLADQVMVEGNQVVAAAMLPKLFAPGLDAGDPLIEQVRQIILATPRAGLVGSLKGMAVRHDSVAMLCRINVPALILTGDQDQLIPRAKSEAMDAAIPGATLTIVEKAGHLPMLERPKTTTTALREFLGTLP
jgi:3-oxoadipate enol-lactonase